MQITQFEERFFLELSSLFDKEERPSSMALAVSGGSDSLALLLLVKKWAQKKNTKIVALTVDHGLRKEAQDEAKQVAKLCQKLEIPHHILLWEDDKPKADIQAEARNARYGLLRGFCEQNRIDILVAAHQKNDVAENFLIRLARGSGLDGLSAISKKQKITPKLWLLRPLLGFSRQELKDYLKENNKSWIEDPSNQDTHYKRVQMRNLLPQLDEVGISVERLSNAAKHLRRVREALDFFVQKTWEDVAEISPLGFIRLNQDKWQKLPEEIGLRVLCRALMLVSGSIYPPRFERLLRLYCDLKENKIGKGVTLSGCAILPDAKANFFWLVMRELNAVEKAKSLEPLLKTKWDNRFWVKVDALGVKVSALGISGWVEVKKTLHKKLLPPRLPSLSLPAFYDEKGLAAVPSLGWLREREEAKNFWVSYIAVDENDGLGLYNASSVPILNIQEDFEEFD